MAERSVEDLLADLLGEGEVRNTTHERAIISACMDILLASGYLTLILSGRLRTTSNRLLLCMGTAKPLRLVTVCLQWLPT